MHEKVLDSVYPWRLNKSSISWRPRGTAAKIQTLLFQAGRPPGVSNGRTEKPPLRLS